MNSLAVQKKGTKENKVTTAGQDRFLCLRALREINSTATMLRGALQNVSNLIVSTQNVRNRLHERGLHARRSLRSPAIRHGNRARCVLWCQQHQNWTVDQWGQVLFTDESRFGLHPDSRRMLIWRLPGNAERLRNLQGVYKFQGASIMEWAGIMTNRKTYLFVVRGTQRANVYI